MRSRKGRYILSSAFLAVMAVTRGASADTPHLTVDWEHLLIQGMKWAHLETESQKEQAHPRQAQVALPEHGTPELGTAWVGVAPKVSFVARDWGTARAIAGGPITLTDAVRVSRSNRMVLSRIRLGEGRIIPFAQLGLGQWRVDTDVLPHLQRDEEVAAQFGGGFELRLFANWQLAAETDLTVLYREMREPQQAVTPRLWGTFLATKVQF
jgi:hypothetical protein